MAATTWSSTVYGSGVSTAAYYNTWATYIYNAFITCGWLQTSDTGQTSFGSGQTGTLNANLANIGYQIFQSNDSLTPIYLKVVYFDFGNGVGAGGWGITIAVGWGTNGAGTLTGNTSSATISTNATWNSVSGTGTTTSYASGDTTAARLTMFVGAITPANPANGQYFSIERSRDANGNATSAYVIFKSGVSGYTLGGVSTYYGRTFAIVPQSGTTISINESFGLTTTPAGGAAGFNCEMPSSLVTLSGGGNLNAGVHYPILYNGLGNPQINEITYYTTDTAPLIPMTFNWGSYAGGNHTYLPLGSLTNTYTCTRNASMSGLSLMMRYE